MIVGNWSHKELQLPGNMHFSAPFEIQGQLVNHFVNSALY